jgi:hypothetical protein
MTSVKENLLYELLYHERTKIFLKKFQEGLGAGIFMEALNLPFDEARERVNRLGQAADSYTRGIYDLEVKSSRYKKSYSCFIIQPNVIALKFRYILNTLSANYPGEYFKFCNAIASYIFDGRRPLQATTGGNKELCRY